MKKILTVILYFASLSAHGEGVEELVLTPDTAPSASNQSPAGAAEIQDQASRPQPGIYPRQIPFNPSEVDRTARSSAFLKPNRVLLRALVKNANESADFLLYNELKPGVVKLPNGVQYKVLVRGNGRVPQDTDIVKVQYQGKLINGTIFETSGKQPVDVKVGPLIPGLKSAIKLMPINSKWEIYIPPLLGFGADGKPPKVGPDMVLIYEINLLGINTPVGNSKKSSDATDNQSVVNESPSVNDKNTAAPENKKSGSGKKSGRTKK